MYEKYKDFELLHRRQKWWSWKSSFKNMYIFLIQIIAPNTITWKPFQNLETRCSFRKTRRASNNDALQFEENRIKNWKVKIQTSYLTRVSHNARETSLNTFSPRGKEILSFFFFFIFQFCADIAKWKERTSRDTFYLIKKGWHP